MKINFKLTPVFNALGAVLVVLLFSFFALKTVPEKAKKAHADLTATNQADMPLKGKVTFTQQKNGEVKMVLEITVPKKANQSVAVHLHEHGDCGDMGNNAHGHWNPTNTKHGKWGSGEFHSGDIGNISLDS